jgi:haloalkane dehalogenase
MGPETGELFSQLRTTGAGQRMVLQENFFVEQVLPAGMNRHLTAAEHDAYREPFRAPRDRLPVLRWIQQIPVGGDPADVDAVVRHNPGTHFLPEDQPRAISQALAGWLAGPAHHRRSKDEIR